MMREAGGNKIDVQRRDLLRRERGTRFHQHFHPHAETIGIELLVTARLIGMP